MRTSLPEAEAEAEAEAQAGPEPDSGVGVGVGAGLGPGAGSEPVPEVERDAAHGPDPQPGRLPWYRRRAAAVVAAGVTAGAVAVAVLAASLPDRGTGPRMPAVPGATGVTGTTAGPAVTGSAAPTASPAPSEPAGSPAPEASPTPGPGSAAPPAGSRPPVPAPVPLKAAVRTHVWAYGCDHAYLAERGPGSVPPPPVEADAPAWASAQRAVHAGTQIVEVTLHGTGGGAVVLEDLEVRVAARRTPPAWNVYQMSQGCGGGLTPASFAVNLDAPRPLARPVAGAGVGVDGPVPAPAFPLRVSASEPVVLRVEASTTGCDCDWYLDLRWSGPAGSGTLRIDDGGRPLRTSTATGRPVYGYATEQGRWGR